MLLMTRLSRVLTDECNQLEDVVQFSDEREHLADHHLVVAPGQIGRSFGEIRHLAEHEQFVEYLVFELRKGRVLSSLPGQGVPRGS